MKAETRIVEPEETAVARKRQINKFPWQDLVTLQYRTAGNGVFYWVRPEAVARASSLL
jgi:hypothetical protein